MALTTAVTNQPAASRTGPGELAEQRDAVAQQHHEDEDHGQEEAVDDLGQEHDADEGQSRDQDDDGRGAEEEREQPVERRRLAGPESRPRSRPSASVVA